MILRVAIGWHFMYEGITKLLNPNWSSLGYLMDSKGLFGGMFHAMDFLNVWGLVLIGVGFVLPSTIQEWKEAAAKDSQNKRYEDFIQQDDLNTSY